MQAEEAAEKSSLIGRGERFNEVVYNPFVSPMRDPFVNPMRDPIVNPMGAPFVN